MVPPHIQIRKDISTCSAPATHNEQGSLVKRDIGQLQVVQSSRHSNGSQDHSHQVPNSIPDMAEMVDGTLECAQGTGMMVCVYRNKMMYCQKPHLDERCLSWVCSISAKALGPWQTSPLASQESAKQRPEIGCLNQALAKWGNWNSSLSETKWENMRWKHLRVWILNEHSDLGSQLPASWKIMIQVALSIERILRFSVSFPWGFCWRVVPLALPTCFFWSFSKRSSPISSLRCNTKSTKSRTTHLCPITMMLYSCFLINILDGPWWIQTILASSFLSSSHETPPFGLTFFLKLRDNWQSLQRFVPLDSVNEINIHDAYWCVHHEYT